MMCCPLALCLYSAAASTLCYYSTTEIHACLSQPRFFGDDACYFAFFIGCYSERPGTCLRKIIWYIFLPSSGLTALRFCCCTGVLLAGLCYVYCKCCFTAARMDSAVQAVLNALLSFFVRCAFLWTSAYQRDSTDSYKLPQVTLYTCTRYAVAHITSWRAYLLQVDLKRSMSQALRRRTFVFNTHAATRKALSSARYMFSVAHVDASRVCVSP